MYYLYRLIVAVVRFFSFGRCRYTRITEGNAATMKLRDMLIWASKYYGQPTTEPLRGSNVESWLKNHPISGFAEKLEASVPTGASIGAPTCIPVGTPLGALTDPPADDRNAAPSGVRANSEAQQLTIALAGDILPSPYMRKHCTTQLFADIEDSCFGADLRCANLEAPLVTARPTCWPEKEMTTPPLMNNSEEAFDLCYRDGAGFNIFSTANNHALDQSREGLLATLDFLDAKAASHVGTARNATERNHSLLREAAGFKIAVLAYTFSLNRMQLPEDEPWLVNHIRLNLEYPDLSIIKADINRVRKQQGAEIVLVCLHWGLEYELWPLPCQLETAHQLLEAGANIIAGNHPHGLQSSERYTWQDETGHERDGLVCYALGDLVSDAPDQAFSALTAVMLVTVSRAANGEAQIVKAQLRPLYNYRSYDQGGNCLQARLLDITTLQARLAKGDESLVFTPEQRRQFDLLSTVYDRLYPSSTPSISASKE